MALPNDEQELVAMIARRFRMERPGAKLELDALQLRFPRLSGDFATLRDLVAYARSQGAGRDELFGSICNEVLRRFPGIEQRAGIEQQSVRRVDAGHWPS